MPQPAGLRPRNPGLAPLPDGTLLMCYREGPLGMTKLRLQRLAVDGDDCRLIGGSSRLVIHEAAHWAQASDEDPRLSVFGDRILLTLTRHMPRMPATGMWGGWLDVDAGTVSLAEFMAPGRQKNWVPVACDGKHVIFSYDLGAGQTCRYAVPDYESAVPREGGDEGTPAAQLWGPARGGTNVVPYEGGLLSIAHSSYTVPQGRLYVGFPVLMQAVPPHAVLWTGPLILAGDHFEAYPRGRKAVVFPSGLVRLPDGDLLIAAGHNDKEIRLWRCDPNLLRQQEETSIDVLPPAARPFFRPRSS